MSFVWRPWLWQTCTEFGWYQTTNQADQKYGSSLPLEFFEQWCSDAFGADITHETLQRSVTTMDHYCHPWKTIIDKSW